MTSTTTPVLDAVPVPADEPPTVARPTGPTAGCTVLTLAVGAVAVTAPPHPTGVATALVLAAVTIFWSGGTAYRTAWAALRRGRVTAHALTAAGLTAVLGAAAAAAVHEQAGFGAAVAAAAGTLHAAGTAVAARIAAEDTTDTPTVERARRGAAALERAAERAAAGFAAVVVVAAVAVLGHRLGGGAGAADALGVAASVLLVACPLAVGRATATALVAGVARSARLGALLDAPRTAETLSRVDTVVLCRTGTLTTGARCLRTVHVADGVEPEEALRVAGAVAAAGREAGGVAGQHPVGAVLADAARERFGELPGVAEFDGYPGFGVRGIVTELRFGPDDEPRVLAHAALVGRVALLAAHGIVLPDELHTAVATVHAAGATAVAVSWDGVARAVFEVAAPTRPGAASAAHALRDLGLTSVLLTGDDPGAARGLAAVLGVEEVLAEVGATDRGAAVARLREAGRAVAVVGGPADHAALAEADVALVGPGAVDGAVLRRPGVVTLVDVDPRTAVDTLRAARAMARTIERTLTGAAAYHLVALPAAVAGLLPPLAAAVAAAVFPAGALLYVGALRRIRALPRPEAADES